MASFQVSPTCRRQVAEALRAAAHALSADAGPPYPAKARYQHFNRLLFESRLPRIPIFVKRLKGVGGKASAKGRRNPDGKMIVDPLSLKITLDNTFARSEQQMDGILIHEMMHIHFYLTDPAENHGPNFRQMVRDLSKRLGFDVPLTDKTSTLELAEGVSARIGVIIRFDTHVPIFAIVNAKTLPDSLDHVTQPHVLVAIISSPHWTRKAQGVPVQRNAARLKWWRVKPEDVEDLRKHGEVLLDTTTGDEGQTQLQAAIDVRQWAEGVEKALGLKAFDVWESKPGGHLHLQTLAVPKERRGEGVGSKAMEQLCELADQLGRTITLTPALPDDRWGTTSRSRLIRFYKRFGFVENKGRRKDFTFREGMYRLPQGKVSASTAAHRVAVSLLVDAPDLSLEEAMKEVESVGELWDVESREMVPAHDVLQELRRLIPEEHPGEMVVYHATDAATAKLLLRRGFIPETKPRLREGFDFAPGRGVDAGLYVGATPKSVEGYGRVILEVHIPKRFLEVPTELAQLGERDPMRALKSHDGAVVNHRLPASAFREHQ